MADKILMKYYDDETFTQNLKFKQKEIDQLSVNSINREKNVNEINSDNRILKIELINFINSKTFLSTFFLGPILKLS